MGAIKHELIYSRFNGDAFGDHEAESIAKQLKEGSWYVSTENVIHAFRLLLLQEYFEPDEITVLFEKNRGEFLPVVFDEHGRTMDWHEGFCDTSLRVIQELLEGQIPPPKTGWIPPKSERHS